MTVSDDKLGDITCPQTTLAAKDDQSDADEMTCYATPLDGITADTTNIATAKGFSIGEGTEVSDTDDAIVEIVGPAITVVKTAGASAGSQVADDTDYETEAFPSNVTYSYLVTNTGTTTLVTVSLSDDKLGSITCPKTALVVGESMTCTATTTVLVDTPNIGTATGTSAAGATKTATDPAMVVILTPSISIVKTAGDAANGDPYYTDGGPVTYTYVVTNTGEVALSDVVVTDDKLPTVTCPQDTLAIGESMTCTATGTITVDTTNVGSVEGKTPHKTVTDTDDAVVLVRDASIEKTNDATGTKAPGDTVAYTITLDVVNGPIPALTVVDTLPANFGTPSAISDGGVYDSVKNEITWKLTNVADGEVLTYSVEIATTTQGGDYVNTAEITEGPCATTCDDDSTVPVWRVAIEKTNDATGTKAPGDTVAYTLTLDVQNGPIAAMKVVDTLPANFGTPSAISDGGVYDAATRTITWTLADVADGETLTYSVEIATTTQGGDYVNTAEITEGPCVAGECDDDSTVPVWRVAIEKANDAEAPLLEGDNVHYTLTFDVQNGPITSMTVTDTLPAEVVNPRDFSVAPASVVGQVITWNLSNVADGATITYTATIADGTAAGSYTNVAEITDGPCVAGDCDDDSTVRVVTASISLVKTAGNAADGTTLRVDKPGNVIFTYVVKNTGTADLENLELIDDNATPANTTDDVKVTCPSTTLAAGASMTCTATLPVVVGSRTNIAVVTANPELDNETEVSDSDDAVVLVPEPVKPTPKPTPKVTPPPTSTIDGTDNGTTGTTGLLLVFAALAGLMLAVGYLNPARATARKRSRRG